MLNIVIPMAGLGSRFAREGYSIPKPLIPIHGTPMIQVVINNLRPKMDHRFIFICQRKHVEEYDLHSKLEAWSPGCSIIQLDGLTEGAACTVLSAKDLINTDDPLMVANSDQYVDISIDDYLCAMDQDGLTGLIMTMKASDPKWSFVGLNDKALVEQVVEKQVISDEATVGIYNFKHGCDFVCAAEDMISENQRVNGEFYVAPAYNKLIENGKRVGIYNVGCEGAGMYGLGIPSDLEHFQSLSLSQRVVSYCI